MEKPKKYLKKQIDLGIKEIRTNRIYLVFLVLSPISSQGFLFAINTDSNCNTKIEIKGYKKQFKINFPETFQVCPSIKIFKKAIYSWIIKKGVKWL